MTAHSAAVIGSGPNGLAAAIRLLEAGFSVKVYETHDTPGGGARTKELTLPGFQHDVCSAVHPLGISSPFFRSLPLDRYGLEWIHSPVAAAHPLGDASQAAVLYRSLEKTAENLGVDESAYKALLAPLLRRGFDLLAELLSPLHFPKYPLEFLRVGLAGAVPPAFYGKVLFRDEPARAFFAGMAAHSQQPLEHMITGAFGLMMLFMGHLAGWPVVKGGSQRLTDALVRYIYEKGGELVTGRRITSLTDIPPEDFIFLDIGPKQALQLAGDRFPKAYQDQLRRFRYGMGIYKMDFALSAPIPWKAEECRQAASIHLGGSLEEIAASERDAWNGRHSPRPYIILAQPSLFDDTRAPAGCHTAWAYCHVPHGSTVDMSQTVENQIERYAPGFKRLILAKAAMNSAQMADYNPNYVGGDINGGVQDLGQFFTRPVLSLDPYRTPDPNIFFCSSSTPPGGGVHGLCGEYAVKSALRHLV